MGHSKGGGCILKETTREYIMFTHAISCCDTTFRLHGVGKQLMLKKLLCDSKIGQHAEIICLAYIPTWSNYWSWEKAIASLYNWGKTYSLDKLRCQGIKAKVVGCSKQIEAQVLPLTSGATKYHLLRMFHQTGEWKGKILNATECGLKEKDGKFIPLWIDLPQAADHLLAVIHGNYKAGCSTQNASLTGMALNVHLLVVTVKALAALKICIQRLMRLKLMNEQSQSFKNFSEDLAFICFWICLSVAGSTFFCYLVNPVIFA